MATRLLPEIVSVTPTGYEAFTRCSRSFLLGHLLAIPASDEPPSPDLGLLVHALLRAVHLDGSCRDGAHVDDVLDAHGASDPLVRDMIARHARRCPAAVERSAHEVDLARFHRRPPPMFMATARIDVVWVHDGLLDARDYKTGARWYSQVADDPRARVQAYVLARAAQARGLRLVLRYEHLAPEVDDDPDPWEPDDDDIAAVEEELRGAVARMSAGDDWAGCADTAVCRTCRYRSICAHSAAPSEPSWAALSAAGDRTTDR